MPVAAMHPDQAIPPALLLVVPFVALSLLCRLLIRRVLCTPLPRVRSRVLPVVLSLGAVSIIASLAGSLGLLAVVHDEPRIAVTFDILMTLMKTTLGACLVYVLFIAVPNASVALRFMFVHNLLYLVLITIATPLSIGTPYAHLNPVLGPVFYLLSALYPIPVLIICVITAFRNARNAPRMPPVNFDSLEKGDSAAHLVLRDTRTRFWTCILSAQIAGVLSALFNLALSARAGQLALATLGSFFTVLWASGLIFGIDSTCISTGSSSHFGSSCTSPSSRPGTSASTRSHASHDFRNLRDPFASPGPSSAHMSTVYPSTPEPAILATADSPGKKQRKARKKTSSSTMLLGDTTSGMLPMSESAPTSPTAANFDVGVNTEEALLTQVLLHALDCQAQGAPPSRDQGSDVSSTPTSPTSSRFRTSSHSCTTLASLARAAAPLDVLYPEVHPRTKTSDKNSQCDSAGDPSPTLCSPSLPSSPVVPAHVPHEEKGNEVQQRPTSLATATSAKSDRANEDL